MTSNHRLQLPACCAVLFLATVLQAGASDGASFVSQTILTNAVMAPGQTFTQTWTMQNTGTTTWSAGASGYTLNLGGTDSLGAVPLFARTSGTVYLPCATNNGGSSVAPGASGTFSMYFIAPETAGTYSDTLQMANASAVSFGPKVGVQIVVQQAGPAGQYDRAKAVSYANNYAAYVCSDGYFWTNSSNFGYYGTGVFTPVPTSSIGDDCAHFVSCCIGSESHQKGGGLTIPTRDVTYGEPGAARLVQTVLLGGGLATNVSSLNSLSPGDVIGWNWSGDTNLADIDHDTIYLGNGVLAAHSSSHLDVSATTYYQGSYPQLVWHLIHILNKADTIPPTVAISSPTNGQTFTSSTIALSGTANDAGCPSSGVALVQAQTNGTGGTWQTASGTNNWSASASLNSGPNTVYVRSRDGAGNYSTVASVNVTYTPPDTQGPALAITSPANNATVTSASLPVSGTACDSGCGNDGVSSVTVNGVSASGGTATGAGTANWSATITLSSGANTVTVVAKDTLNNSSQQQITVTYNPPDTQGPAVAITSPVNGAVVTSASLPVSGTASDSGCGNNGVSSVTVNGVSASGGTASGSGAANWSATVALNSGANLVTVTAKDTLNNSSQQQITVTYNPPDTQGPALAITSPANNATVTSASLSVSGTASDSGCGNNGVSSVTVNGVSASGGTASGAGTANWSATIALNSGANLVTVTAEDTLNNSSQQQITVTYTPPPPSFGGSSVSGAEFQTTLSGLSAGETVVLEVSSDLQNWTPMQTNTASDSTCAFTNAVSPAVQNQFFRARVQ